MCEKRNKRQRLIEPLRVGHGQVALISARPGGMAEKILRRIAHPDARKLRNSRYFDDWENGSCLGSVRFERHRRDSDNSSANTPIDSFELTLRLTDDPHGLVLRDVSSGRCSVKAQVGNVIEVGQDLPDDRIDDMANQIVACWVIHGSDWRDRTGKLCNWPYGNDPRPAQFKFNVIDGTGEVTLGELAKLQAVRSTHIGEWNMPFTVAPAACGLTIILHEWNAGNEGIRNFGSIKIADAALGVWAPYCNWAAQARESIARVDPRMHQIAYEAASPFLFHLHATKEIFPTSVIASHHLLASIGETKLRGIFTTIAENEPKRFYRIIDEEGNTHRLKTVKGNTLVYEKGNEFSLQDVPNNLIHSFQQLSKMQDDLSYEIPRMKRVVPDTHFYIVVSACAKKEKANDASHQLSGKAMYKYLMEGDDSHMHAARNERLYLLLQRNGYISAETFNYHIYPAVAFNGVTQYTFDRDHFDAGAWASTLVI